ncbi:MAG: malto-oligosyltrehalose trehalohydrolase [Proteobacteria bacterium]|nr:MAG: malto-oligosyltrehalose trehalohydrolase [Pseudomonadota bacterium]
MSGFQFGPELTPSGVNYRLWAPAAKTVELLMDRPLAMQAADGAWYSLHIPDAGGGARYKFRINGALEVPDPASAFQPEDVSGPSEVVDHESYRWAARDWRGRPWHETAIQELHVGAFTPSGTFRAAVDKLDHVVAAGFTAIELMPIADFAGRRNWGYDGVLFYAPDSAYGRPDDLKAMIDAAHQRGLMVFLDVVYNHFGPEGNYLAAYAPQFFTAARTPWGSAIDYRVPAVRAFAIQNALHWIDRYRFDGLRLDAVHAISAPGTPHLLEDLSRAVGRYAEQHGRYVHLMLENDNNCAGLLDPRTDPPRGRYRAQWNDDYHHAWHVLLTGERHGYYVDYAHAPFRQIARVLACGFAYQGETSVHRKARRGEPSNTLPPDAFVNFLQNHDQIGNRPFGDRLTTQADARALEAALAITLLAPMPPLMFMGEEWGSIRPFPFFCDFTGDLAEAVRKGRREEFKAAYTRSGDKVPDPLLEETFRSAVLDWDARFSSAGKARLDLVTRLFEVRQREIVPRIPDATFGNARVNGSVLEAEWNPAGGGKLRLVANLGETAAKFSDDVSGKPIWGGPQPPSLPPYAVFWSVGAS